MAIDIDLRREAREIFNVALRRVDAGDAVRAAVQIDGPHLTISNEVVNNYTPGRPVFVLAVGKAAIPMAAAISEVLVTEITEGLVIGPYPGHYAELRSQFGTRWRVCDGSHPIPTYSSIEAARYAVELMGRANDEQALVIFLVSGGGSSMIERPIDDVITLADLQTANRTLVECGANISEINAVRIAISAIKGGRLAKRAPDTDQITLIVSDTPQGQESIVASGPTFDPPLEGPSAYDVILRHKLVADLPESILHAAKFPREQPVKNAPDRIRRHCVLLDSKTALNAACEEAYRRSFVAESSTDISEQPIAEGCELMLARTAELYSRNIGSDKVVCLISSGEFSCPVIGNGIGGRNAETVLRCAITLGKPRSQDALTAARHIAVLSAGTDGIDGNSPAAGAAADETSVERAGIIGIEPRDFLEGSDAYNFFKALDEAIVTGPTGTNVRDLRIVLAV